MADFHEMIVLSTRNFSEGVQCPIKLALSGTGFTTAPVLLFELHLAINSSSTIHSEELPE